MNKLLSTTEWMIKDSTIKLFREKHRDYIPSVIEDCCYQQMQLTLSLLKDATPDEIDQIYKRFGIPK
jgi:hypothetical protein